MRIANWYRTAAVTLVVGASAVAFQNCSGFGAQGLAPVASLRDIASIRTANLAGATWSLDLSPATGNFLSISAPVKLLDAQSQVVAGENTVLGYSYGASIITSDDGTGIAYHSYSCGADYTGNGWDKILYTRSTDRVHWTNPTVPLHATLHSRELSACDPAVIRNNFGDGLFYYLYYGGGDGNMYVARSRLAAGPFLKFTMRGTWEENAADPKYVIAHSSRVSFDTFQSAEAYYGAGEPTIVVLDGRIHVWYKDDTTTAPGIKSPLVLYRTATSPTQFSEATPTNIPAADADNLGEVRYDDAHQRFIFFGLRDQLSLSSRLSIAASSDGITWTDPKEYCSAPTCLPNYASNIGVSSNELGHMIGNEAFITYGAPWDLSGATCGPDLCWARWSLYGGALQINMGATSADFRISTGTNLLSLGNSQGTTPTRAPANYTMGSANASESLWPAENAIDGTSRGVYSSQPFASAANDRNVQLAAWFADGAQMAGRLQLKARLDANGAPLAFATNYTVYLTNAANTGWEFAGEFGASAGAGGLATIQFSPRMTWGVLIIPRTLAYEGSAYYFQLDEISLLP